MAYVMLFFGLGALAIAAFNAEMERSTRIFCLAVAALNLFGAYHAISSNDPYAWRLRPNDGYVEPPYRR